MTLAQIVCTHRLPLSKKKKIKTHSCPNHRNYEYVFGIKHEMYNIYQNNLAPPPEVTPPQKVVRFDKDYFSKLPGILQLVQLMCNIIGFICIKVSWSFVSAIFYNILYWFGNIITLFLFLSYTFHLVEKYDRWPWNKYELFFCVIMSLAYIVCSIFATVIGESVGYAVGFFGLCALIAYGFDGYLKYKAWKRGLPPQ